MDADDHARRALVTPAADATTPARWRALAVTDPIAKLVRNAAHAGIDADVYDLRLLALAAVDLAVSSMGFAREAGLEDVVDTLTELATRMEPKPPEASTWRDVAQAVVKGLLNDAHEQRRFSYVFADLADPETCRFEPYSFRLLNLRDTEYGPVVTASDQAIMLYLGGLNVDVEDTEAALAVVLQRQLDDGRFDAAVRTATQAERTSLAMAADLTDLLEDTTRDVHSRDWRVDVPERLARARRHVEERLSEDDRVFEHVQAAMDTEATPEVRAVSGQIVDLLHSAKRVHLALERRLVGAREVFLSAQVRQRLARPRRLRLLDIGQELFLPVLGLPVTDGVRVSQAFGDAALGVTQPRLLDFDELVAALWAAPRIREVGLYQPEDPGDGAAEDVQTYPAEVLAAARDVLEATRATPVRLSHLLDAAIAAEGGLDGESAGSVTELVLLAALWAFAPDYGDTDVEASTEVDLLASGLRSVDDGAVLAHPVASGADLLVAVAGSAGLSEDEDVGGVA